MARRLQRAPGRRPRANFTWAGISSAALVTIPAASKVLLGTFSLETSFDETVRRIRGDLWIQSDQAAANEQQFGAFGLAVVSEAAATAGIASLPDPITEISEDLWFLYTPFLQSTNGGANNGLGFHYPLESKAMRKVTDGYQVAIIVANSHASHGLSMAMNLRLLSSFAR